MNRNHFALWGLAGILALGFTNSEVRAASLISNGDMELWNSISGTPPQGTPTGWQGGGTVIRSAGLVAGSTYSAVVQAGQSGLYYTPLLASASAFEVSFTLAATDSGAGRSFNLLLTQTGAAGANINLRAVRGSSGAGSFSIQASTTSGWQNIVENLSASVYSGSTTNAFTTLNAYQFDLLVDFNGASSYSFSYGLAGSPMTTISNLTYFATAPIAGVSLGSIGFVGSNSASNYGVDNITLTTVPEPSVVALAILGVTIIAGSLLRRRRALGV